MSTGIRWGKVGLNLKIGYTQNPGHKPDVPFGQLQSPCHHQPTYTPFQFLASLMSANPPPCQELQAVAQLIIAQTLVVSLELMWSPCLCNPGVM